MCCLRVIVTGSLETGALQVALLNSTRKGSPSANAPLVSTPGSLTDSAASPALLITFAVVVAVYSLSAPGVNGAKLAGVPSVNDNVAGTVPPTEPGVVVSAYSASAIEARMSGARVERILG